MTQTAPGRDLEPRTESVRHGRALLAAAAAGVLLTWVWSYTLVDTVIGDGVADSLLGHHARTALIDGPFAGIVFSVVTGLAGTLSACNVAVLTAVAPLVDRGRSRDRRRLVAVGTAWMAGAALAVSAAYGVVLGVVGTRMPQLSTRTYAGLPGRVFQASVVFVVVGLVMLVMALVLAGVLGASARAALVSRPKLQLLVMGGLLGALIAGRPLPLAQKVLAYSVHHHDPLYTAAVTAGQTLANLAVALVVVLVVLAFLPARVRAAVTARAASINIVGLTLFGVFQLVYWGLRVPAIFGIGWYPPHPFT